MSIKKLKTSFRVESKIENIYTGGPVDLSTDERLLITSCDDHIKVFDTKHGNVILDLEGDGARMTAFALSPDMTTLVSCSTSLLLRSWDFKPLLSLLEGEEAASKESIEKVKELVTCTRKWKGHTVPVASMAYDATSTLVATGGTSDRCIRVWDVEKGYCTHNFKGHEGIVHLVKFHKDPNRMQLFSASADCTVRIWDLVSKTCCVISDHVSPVTSISFSSNGWEIITGGRDKVVMVFDIRTASSNKVSKKSTIPIFETLETAHVVSSSMFPKKFVEKVRNNRKIQNTGKKDMDFLITGGEKGTIKLWDLETSEQIGQQEDEENQSLTKAIVSSLICKASKRIACVTEDQNIVFRYLDAAFALDKLIVGYNDDIIDLKYIDSQYLSVATNSEQVRIFDVKDHSCRILSGHTDLVVCQDVNKFTKMLATGSKDHNIRLWDTSNFKCLATCEGHTDAVGSICFAKKSASNFFVSGSKDKTMKMWNIEKGAVEGSIVVHAKQTVKAHDKDINSIAIAPNDKLLASGSQDKTVKLWSTSDLSLIATLKGHKRGVWNVCFSPVDQCIASSSGDKTIKIWSAVDFTCLKTFEGHTNSVLQVHFITHGMQVVSCGGDGLIKLWTIKSNECVDTFDGHTEKVWALAVSADEDRIISGGSDSLINVWKDFTVIDEEERARSDETRILREQELHNSLHNNNYKKAISIAFDLEQPFRLLTIMEKVLEQEGKEMLQRMLVETVVGKRLETCVQYIRDWNTNARHSAVAQTVLKCLLATHKSSTFIEEIPHIKELLEGLIPYTERHYQRIDRLLQQSFILDYSLKRMDTLLTNVVEEEMKIDTPEEFIPVQEETTDSQSEERISHKSNGTLKGKRKQSATPSKKAKKSRTKTS